MLNKIRNAGIANRYINAIPEKMAMCRLTKMFEPAQGSSFNSLSNFLLLEPRNETANCVEMRKIKQNITEMWLMSGVD